MITQTQEEKLDFIVGLQKANDNDEVIKIEDTDEEDDNSDDDNEVDVEGASRNGDTNGKSDKIISKSEKKTRKAMFKLGLDPITGVSRVTLRNQKNDLIVISKPDVFMCPTTETYIFFGQATVEDITAQLQIQPAQKFKFPDLTNVIFKDVFSAMDPDDAEVYEAGLLPQEVELVMTQTGMTWGEAFTALKANDGDVVATIMNRLLDEKEKEALG